MLVLLLVVVGLGGYAVGDRAPAPISTAGTHLTPLAPAGKVETSVISLTLASGWNEEQQTSDMVVLLSEPNGYIEANRRSQSAVGVSSTAALLARIGQDIAKAPQTLHGAVSACVPPTALVIGGKAGTEQGFQWQEKGYDGTTVFTNCEVAWAAMIGGQVYFWETFNTTDKLPSTLRAARSMQESVTWS